MSKAKVMVVDDSPTDLKLMCKPFETSGYLLTLRINDPEYPEII